ncbi:MAG: hypothetical protein ACOYN9_12765 [Saprospiraceae bacterium]|jgi:hypothetical protein
MTIYFKIILAVLLLTGSFFSCEKDSFVDEDGLLITFRSECFVSNFELLGADFVTVRAAPAVIDTVAQTIDVSVLFGTDLKNVYPQFTLATDCKLDPKITGKMDLSNLSDSKIFTVVSGNRLVRKPYKLIIKYQ